MPSRTTILLDDEAAAAIEELVAIDGTKTRAISRAVVAQLKRRRQQQALIDMIAEYEAEHGEFSQDELAAADELLDRQGVPR